MFVILTFVDIVIVNISTPVEYNLQAQLARLRSAVQRNETVNNLWLPSIIAPTEKQKIIVGPKLRTEHRVPSIITFSKNIYDFKSI